MAEQTEEQPRQENRNKSRHSLVTDLIKFGAGITLGLLTELSEKSYDLNGEMILLALTYIISSKVDSAFYKRSYLASLEACAPVLVGIGIGRAGAAYVRELF